MAGLNPKTLLNNERLANGLYRKSKFYNNFFNGAFTSMSWSQRNRYVNTTTTHEKFTSLINSPINSPQAMVCGLLVLGLGTALVSSGLLIGLLVGVLAGTVLAGASLAYCNVQPKNGF